MQKVGAQYLVKRFADQLMAPPPAPADSDEAAESNAPAVAPAPAGDLDGQVVRDESGRRLGIARRVHDIAVYVIAEAGADREQALADCLEDPGMQVLLSTTDDHLTGLIYVPDPSRGPRQVEGTRADEV
ncbi:MAG: hypothetical protein AVDCRST_MAG49-4740 [uncultured Thermomicrobiales bacterium]|uniref:Uncharacterized protein n=1 Tax=uncultured Thermomicrobiales bacterium TaxID=1645740 RepID=A0A6J4VKQ1_9BACT|nr:MAG: hypothetical protein AVDCRST_MAG49-4740 [uncultured Thermomicrobiales bacterium]